MDIHTELPTGDRAIFEVFTQGSHSDKDKQLADYARLLNLARDANAEQILLTDDGQRRQRIDKGLLFDLLETDFNIADGVEIPGELHDRIHLKEGFERMAPAESLNYTGYGPDYSPPQQSRKIEREIMKALRSHGYEPRLPVFRAERFARDGCNFCFCGPTIYDVNTRIGDLTLTFHSNREQRFDDETVRNKRVWGYNRWYSALAEMNDNAVAVIEVDEMQQSKLHPGVLGWLLDA
jgi:hypothetical protein